MKAAAKGYVAGVLTVLLLISTTAVVYTQTTSREITHGINVMLNGQMVSFDYDSRPFVMGGRTFLPLRALAELLELPVDFDPALNMAIVGNRFVGQRRPLNQAAPHFDVGGLHSVPGFGGISVWVAESVDMSGMGYQNPLIFGTSLSHNARIGLHSPFTLHNLNGQFRMLTGYVGRVDGTSMYDATINFYGDGVLIHSYSLSGADMPTPISVFVEDVRQLRIQVVFANHTRGTRSVHYALVAYLE